MSNPIQKIFFGSPGTGKSYKIDNVVISNDLKIDKSTQAGNIIKTVFHPEYTYGDFVGKLVPLTKIGKVEYNFYEGAFLIALGKAYKNIIDSHDKNGIKSKDAENVVLVIDEINRGNSSAIFGSIFQLLDRDEDGWSSYSVNVNQIIFLKILELIGVSFTYDNRGDIDEYKLKPHEGVRKLETLQEKIKYLRFDLLNKSIKIPPNLSIVATMNTSDSSIYYMDAAFKRRWEWEFVDIEMVDNKSRGTAFVDRREWELFVKKLNLFIKSNHRYIRGIEDKQIGYFFIRENSISKSQIQNKLMFFLWDSVFSRDKKPLIELIFGVYNRDTQDKLITFGDFANTIDTFISKVNSYERVS
jgi:5-methylcytosine-specific restriction endonuclease McrBC GTP-binding regulatory subunit McrB